jgi:hypothetical protein
MAMPYRIVATLKNSKETPVICFGGSEISAIHFMRINKLHLRMRMAYHLSGDDELTGLNLEGWEYLEECSEYGYWTKIKGLPRDFLDKQLLTQDTKLKKSVEVMLRRNQKESE